MGNRKPHLVVIPYPAQGHVAPLLKLSHNLVNHGINVTFVNIHSQHSPILSQNLYQQIPLLTLVSISEGSQSHLQDLIQNINDSNKDAQITHVIADVSLGWALKTAYQMGLNPVAFVPYGLANLAFILHIPKLIEAGIIDANGTPIKEETISLSKDIPPWNHKSLVWSFNDEETQKFLFKIFMFDVAEDVKLCTTILANSFYQLETAASNLIPNILPIGPLMNHSGDFMFAGDSTCLNWLDQQPSGSVIYVAFGSTVFCSQQQLNELAIGFEITNRPFLWVVRSDFTKETAAKLPEGFIERVGSYGKIVEWAPQEKVLAHPSIGCFFSHCGWNSTMEGVSKGVPFLCWPYAVDQFHNRDNICETWKIGVQVMPDENGVVTGHEIKSKIEKLLSDEAIKSNSLQLMEIAGKSIREEGSSFMNFNRFITQIQQLD
ncbi:UDP-glycosyltransferase 83A1-like [Euphorbia lathyris]|uniref:UDP-glycosyltransferase 83A1-like n=1 Tax=Euphorbia lathyris TaxID=212925 RepID=UPI003313B3AF